MRFFHSDAFRRGGRAAAAAVVIMMVAVNRAPGADIRIDIGGRGAEPLNHYSFVRDASRKMIVDFDYATHLRDAMNNDVRWSSVDVVMQQCRSGGFVNDIQARLAGKNYTLATATSWDRGAFNTDEPQGTVPRRLVDNFTRAWRANADMYQDGMRKNFEVAATGRAEALFQPGIPQDPYAPGGVGAGTPANRDFPQYLAPDAANGARKLNNNYFAIVVGWDPPDVLGNGDGRRPNNRHKVNMQRIYSTLRNTYGIPAQNVLSLYGTPEPVGALPGGVAPTDLGGLGGVHDVKTNSIAKWKSALSGALFEPEPAAGSKLFIYNTGHGGDAYDWRAVINNIIGNISGGYRMRIPIDSFDVSGPTPAGMTGDDDNDTLDLSFTTGHESCLDSATLTINGAAFNTLGSLTRTGDPLDPFLNEPLTQYRVAVPHGLLGADPAAANIDLTGFSPGSCGGFEPTLDDFQSWSRAAFFIGGDQSTLAILPEPGTVAFLAFGLIGTLARRTRRLMA